MRKKTFVYYNAACDEKRTIFGLGRSTGPRAALYIDAYGVCDDYAVLVCYSIRGACSFEATLHMYDGGIFGLLLPFPQDHFLSFKTPASRPDESLILVKPKSSQPSPTLVIHTNTPFPKNKTLLRNTLDPFLQPCGAHQSGRPGSGCLRPPRRRRPPCSPSSSPSRRRAATATATAAWGATPRARTTATATATAGIAPPATATRLPGEGYTRRNMSPRGDAAQRRRRRGRSMSAKGQGPRQPRP